MKVIVRQLTRKMYLRTTGEWTETRSGAAEFKTVVEAIMFCIRCKARDVKLVGQNEAGKDVFLYPFGGDPVVKLERKRLRRSVRESRRLKTERRIIRARIDALLAEGKETRKQVPFERKEIREAE